MLDFESGSGEIAGTGTVCVCMIASAGRQLLLVCFALRYLAVLHLLFSALASVL